jgi:hypothetical protein
VRSRGTARDELSDIDLTWIVPDARFDGALAAAPRALASVGPIALLREDPDLQRSDRRRLLFVTYEHLPLFWRVDIDVRAASIADVAGYDEGNPDARGDDWSRPASALMNAIAAIKARRRGDPATARALLERGCARIGAEPTDDPAALAGACAAAEPGLSGLAGRVRDNVQT